MLMASALELPSISTWPSAGARATCSAATTPPAPGTSSTTNGRPKLSESLAASMRARRSGLPPGAAPASKRTGFDGYASCAHTAGHATSTSAASQLVTLDARCLHRGGVALEVFSDEAPIALGAFLAQLHAEVRHALGELALAQRLCRDRLQPVHHLARRADGRLQADDGGDVEIRIAELDRCCHFGQTPPAPGAAVPHYLPLPPPHARATVPH